MTRYLAIVFAVLAVAVGGWAVAQSSQLSKLRADLAALDAERADLRKKIWTAEKLNRELAAQRADPTANSAQSDGTANASAASDAPPRPGDLSDIPGRVMAFMDNPEMQRLMSLTQRANLDGRYSALFKSLHLSPADLEKFKNLLVEKQSSAMDVMAAARAQGLNPRENRDEIRKLVQDSQAEVDNNIRATLGDAAFAQYKTYEQTLPQRNVVSQLSQRLSYTPTPLNDQQTEQLVQVLAQNAPARSTTGRATTALVAGGNAFLGGGGGGNRITDQALAQAQGVLSAPQIEAMRQLQQEQQAQAQLAQQMRANMAARRGGTNNPPPANPPVPPKG